MVCRPVATQIRGILTEMVLQQKPRVPSSSPRRPVMLFPRIDEPSVRVHHQYVHHALGVLLVGSFISALCWHSAQPYALASEAFTPFCCPVCCVPVASASILATSAKPHFFAIFFVEDANTISHYSVVKMFKRTGNQKIRTKQSDNSPECERHNFVCGVRLCPDGVQWTAGAVTVQTATNL